MTSERAAEAREDGPLTAAELAEWEMLAKEAASGSWHEPGFLGALIDGDDGLLFGHEDVAFIAAVSPEVVLRLLHALSTSGSAEVTAAYEAVQAARRALATPVPREDGWDELRRLAEAATPGPWRHGWDDGSGRAEATEGGSITLPGETVIEGQEVVAGGRDSWGIAVGVRKAADADYIAAVSPDVVLRLIDVARSASGEAAAREFIESITVQPLAAARGEPEMDVERLAKVAYEDPPPAGRRPVPWTPGLRRYWTDWARRMVAALDREP